MLQFKYTLRCIVQFLYTHTHTVQSELKSSELLSLEVVHTVLRKRR